MDTLASLDIETAPMARPQEAVESLTAVSLSTKADVPKNYPVPATKPTKEGPSGVLYDFNEGCRVKLPDDQDYTVTIRDLDTRNILFRATSRGGSIQSSKKFYVRFGVDVEDESKSSVLSHSLSLAGREVLVAMPVGTRGDSISWFGYVLKFQKQHQCNLTCVMGEHIIPLFKSAYRNITFATQDAVDTSRFYATYYIGLFFDDARNDWQPTDFRHVGLHKMAAYILGVDPSEPKLSVKLPDETRPIADPYVCIAVQANKHAKKWNNPHGWSAVIQKLKARGYRVICIDKEAAHGLGLAWTHIPNGAEDQTGTIPLRRCSLLVTSWNRSSAIWKSVRSHRAAFS